MNRNRDQAARELLAFYQEAGVDALVDEFPVDRFADPPPRTCRHLGRAALAGTSCNGSSGYAFAPHEAEPVRIRRHRPTLQSLARRRREMPPVSKAREILGRFEGSRCAPPSSCSPTGTRKRA
jgi:hypothetical protein